LGLAIIELARKIKVIISCGISGCGEGVLGDKLVLVVVPCSRLGLTLRARVRCGGLRRIRGGCGKRMLVLLLLIVGWCCPLVIVLCLGRDFMVRVVKCRRSADHDVNGRGGVSGTRWTGMVRMTWKSIGRRGKRGWGGL